MNILALETSAVGGSVALERGPNSEARLQARQWMLPAGERSAKSLAPVIRTALSDAGLKPGDIDLTVVTAGPGSFTGLRVGVVTAKAFAYACGCPAVGVNTLEVIARQAVSPRRTTISAVLDAQRGELFLSEYQFTIDGDRVTVAAAGAVRIVSATAWLEGLKRGTVVTGPGLERIADQIPQGVLIADREAWCPRADMVAQVGRELFCSAADRSHFDPFLLVPQYFRKTAAEEQWEKRHCAATG